MQVKKKKRLKNKTEQKAAQLFGPNLRQNITEN